MSAKSALRIPQSEMEFSPMYQEVPGLGGPLRQFYLPLLGCRVCGQVHADYHLRSYAGPTSDKIVDAPYRLTRHLADTPSRGAATCTLCGEVRTWGAPANKHYAVTRNGNTYGIQPKAESGNPKAESRKQKAEVRKNFSTRWDQPLAPSSRCRWCAQGYVAIESSVRPGIGMMVHPETPVGRVRCADSPALRKTGPRSKVQSPGSNGDAHA
jgi:hypothetical protein